VAKETLAHLHPRGTPSIVGHDSRPRPRRPSTGPGAMRLISELRRRKVFRVAALYAVVAWVVVQVAETTFPLLGLPEWTARLVLVLAIAGFPLAVVLAWAYELTPSGPRAEAPPQDGGRTGAGSSAGERHGAPVTPEAGGVAPVAARDLPVDRPRIPRSIAVLPFANLSPDPENEYFSDGVAEEILDALAKVTSLRVAARTASWAFKGRNPDLSEIAAKLGVDTILQGSIRRAGDRVRISAQLVEVAAGFHIWSERFDREMSDLLAVQEEIARSIVDALRVQLSEREDVALGRAPTADVAAYEHYLLGRWHLRSPSERSVQTAIAMFRRAIEADPTFARAWAGLAEALTFEYTWFRREPEVMEEAARASREALVNGPDLAESLTAHGAVLALERRFAEAHAAFEEAIRLDPRFFEACYMYARTLFSEGRAAEAAGMFARAHEVRPEDYQSLVLQVQAMQAAGAEGGEEVARHALDVIRRNLELNPDDARALYLGAHVHLYLGRREEALEWIDRAIAADPDDPGVAYNVACLYARLGESERAMDILEQRVERGSMLPADWVRNDPDFDSLHDDPRFQRFLERLG
jgi:adenylate cyclase